LERALADIWAEVLKLDRIGVHDDFFELGGHSLPANRVLARVNEELDASFPVRVLFENPTVENLGNFLLQEIATELSAEMT
jgi:acyl carrier protein